MEKLKSLPEVLDPDPRNFAFVRLDTLKPPTLDEHHAEIAATALASKVPEDVRSYFGTIQNVCLYGWFAYDLYTVVDFLCLTAMEMALRQRMPYTGSGRDKRGLQNLMDEAVSKSLIREKAFTHIREMRQHLAGEIRFRRSSGSKFPRSALTKPNYAAILRGTVPWLRNRHAHPRMHTILFPGAAMSALRLPSELINSLFVP